MKERIKYYIFKTSAANITKLELCVAGCNIKTHAITKTMSVESSPLAPPINRKVIIERITPNISVVSNVCTFPVCWSGRSRSKLLPRAMRISCVFVPEKLPWTAWVMALERCSVKLYKCMVLSWLFLLLNLFFCINNQHIISSEIIAKFQSIFVCTKPVNWSIRWVNVWKRLFK